MSLTLDKYENTKCTAEQFEILREDIKEQMEILQSNTATEAAVAKWMIVEILDHIKPISKEPDEI